MGEVIKTGQKAKDTALWMYLLIAIVGIIVTSMVAYSFHIAVRTSAKYAPLIDAAMEIKLEATTAHLWFEEILSGDRHEDMEIVWEHLEQSDWYAQAMLEGGKNPEGTFIPLDDGEMRRKIRIVREKLAEFKDITRKRFATKEISGPGSDIDQRYDAIFAAFINQADKVETQLQQVMKQDLGRIQLTQETLIIICLLLSLLIGTAFRRFERLRAKDYKEIMEANENLEREITERKKAEDVIRKNENQLRLITDNLPVLISYVDSNQRYLFINKSYEEFVDVSKNDAYGKTVKEVLGDSIYQITQKYVEAALSGQKVTFERNIPKKDGEMHYLHATYIPHFEEGQVKGYFALISDITQWKLAEEALRKSQEQLLHSEKLSALGKLTGSIAHEFNNPIYGVQNILRQIKEVDDLDSERKELLGLAIKECGRMANLVKSLRDFYKPTSKDPKLVDIHTLLGDIILLTHKEMKIKKVRLEKEFSSEIPKIKMVEDQIKQVFLNLIQNAVEATDEGETINISTEASDSTLTIRIKDSGQGILPENMDKIFEPFFSTKGAVKGTGLGLSVSYGIIKKHGGDIQVESKPDEGSTFTVALPVKGTFR